MTRTSSCQARPHRLWEVLELGYRRSRNCHLQVALIHQTEELSLGFGVHELRPGSDVSGGQDRNRWRLSSRSGLPSFSKCLVVADPDTYRADLLDPRVLQESSPGAPQHSWSGCEHSRLHQSEGFASDGSVAGHRCPLKRSEGAQPQGRERPSHPTRKPSRMRRRTRLRRFTWCGVAMP